MRISGTRYILSRRGFSNKPTNEALLPAKLDFSRKTVIYALHWTINYPINPQDMGTFHLYRQFFLDLARKHPEINFIFKPHPGLMARLSRLGVMSVEEYGNYQSQWNSLPNGLVLLDDSYLDIFRKSDLLITDSYSFIMEWLASLQPCLYIRNTARPRKDWMGSFSLLARKILKTYYICDGIEQIENAFHRTLLDQDDPKREMRKELSSEIFDQIGQPSLNMVNYLQEVLCC